MILLNKYSDIYDIAKKEREFTINLKNLSVKERLRVIDFLSGLSFNNGYIRKINVDIFKCSY